MQTVAFPGLGLEFTLPRVAVTIFGFPIYWYAVIIAVGFLAAMFYTERTVKYSGLDSDKFFDVMFGSIIAGIVGARIYFVLYSFDNYRDNLLEIFNTRNGGLAIYGGIICGLAAGFFLCRRKKLEFLPAADLVAGGFLIGQAIGRWGNFFNIEAYGSNTTATLGMTSPKITSELSYLVSQGVDVNPALPVHPTFLYESLWCFAGFLIILFFVYEKRSYNGAVFLFYMAWYGFGRMFIEDLRLDSLMLGSVKISQLVAGICFTGSVVLMFYLKSKKARNALPRIFVLFSERSDFEEPIFSPDTAPAEVSGPARSENPEDTHTSDQPKTEENTEKTDKRIKSRLF